MKPPADPSAPHRAARLRPVAPVAPRVGPPGATRARTTPATREEPSSLYRKVFEHSRDGIFLIALDTKSIVDANEAMAALTGYSIDELRERKIYDLVDAPADSIELNIAHTVANSDYVVGPRNYRRKDGTLFEAEVVATVVEDEGRPMICALVRDVTQRNRVHRELAASDERFRHLSAATNDAVWDWDLETDRIWWNDGVRTLFGYAPGEVRNDPAWWYERIFPAEREAVVGGIHELIASGGVSWTDEYRFRRRDGTYAVVFDRGSVIHNEAGRPIRMVGAMMDLTARVRAEEELRKVLRRHEHIMNSAGEGIVELDRYGRAAFVNAEALRILGWSLEDLSGHDFHRMVHHSLADGTIRHEKDCPTHSTIRSGTVSRISGDVFWRKDGSAVRLDYVTSPIREGRDVIGAVMILRESQLGEGEPKK